MRLAFSRGVFFMAIGKTQKRASSGFHRLGILFASLIILFLVVYAFAEPYSFNSNPAAFIFGYSVAAVGLYILTRAFGWIVTGFVGE